MVDHRAMTGPGGVVLEADTHLELFKDWARAGTQNDTQIWMQINHPGRQVFAAMGGKVLSPSDIALDMGKHSHLFRQPTPMSQKDIQEIIQRFTITASRAIEAGFNGIEIHAAHGYLISQFLSPLTNLRQDQWGGSLENRARLLFEIVKSIQAVIPNKAAIAVKLNSADFQKGGFDENDALEVVKGLQELNVDLVELSGGSYESPAMQGNTTDGSTLAREAYFLEFAKNIAKEASMPIMTTGGIVRLPIAQKVLDEGIQVVGLGRALAYAPNLPNQWQLDSEAKATLPKVEWKDKTLSAMAIMAITKRQFKRLGNGLEPKINASPLFSLIQDQLYLKKRTKAYRKKYLFQK